MPSQIWRDLATWSKTEPETDNEILKVCYRIYLCIISILTLECAPTEKGAGRQAGGIGFKVREGREEIEHCYLSRHHFLFIAISLSCLGLLHALVIVVFKLVITMY